MLLVKHNRVFSGCLLCNNGKIYVKQGRWIWCNCAVVAMYDAFEKRYTWRKETQLIRQQLGIEQ